MLKINSNFAELEQYAYNPLLKKISSLKASSNFIDLTRSYDLACPDKFTDKFLCPNVEASDLREYICNEYSQLGVSLNADEVFITHSVCKGMLNFLNLFSSKITVLAVGQPQTEIVAANIMAGNRIRFVQGTVANNFAPPPPDDDGDNADIIIISSPSRVTGTAFNKKTLAAWVAYALERNALIFFDASLRDYIDSSDFPKSIYEIEGARHCAVEIFSLSENKGFGGDYCAGFVIPQNIFFQKSSVNHLWRTFSTIFSNGIEFSPQKYFPENREKFAENVKYYKENCKLLKDALSETNTKFVGGENSPFLWLCFENEAQAEKYTEALLERKILAVPGKCFLQSGGKFIRLSAFSERNDCLRAAEEILKMR